MVDTAETLAIENKDDQRKRTPRLTFTQSEALWTQEQAAEYVNCSPRMLEASRLRGDGPAFVKLSPRMVRYRKKDLDAWIEKQTRFSTAETK